MNKCKFEDCQEKVSKRGYCESHYRKLLNSGKLERVNLPNPKGICPVEGCENQISQKGYCPKHYFNLIRKPKMGKCTFEGCEDVIFNVGTGLCAGHYDQKLHNRPLTVKKKINKDGTGHVNSSGYRMIYRPNHPNSYSNGHVLEHVFVYSEYLGRPILDSENIHHKNGDRLDNRIENLELWSTSQPPGQRIEDKVMWAKEIINLYGNVQSDEDLYYRW